MTIEDIVKSVSTMTTKEIEARIREIRHSRVMAKEVTLTKRPTKKAEKVVDDVADLFAGLSDTEKAFLLKELTK